MDGNAESDDSDDVHSLGDEFVKAEKVINDIESGKFSSSDLQSRIKESIAILEKLTRAVSKLSLFSTNEQVEDIPTSSLPYLLIPCYLGVAQHNTPTTDPSRRREQLLMAQVYYKDFLCRLRNYEFEFDERPITLENEDLLDTSSRSQIKKFTGEEVREQKIARFRKQKELKQTMEELQKQQHLNSDETSLRELHLTVIRYWIEKVLEELNSIEDELPLVEMMANRQQQMQKGPGVSINLPDSGAHSKPAHLKPFIITRTDQQKAVFGLGYPSIPTMTVDEWYNQKFGGENAPSSMAADKPGCSEGHPNDVCEKEHEPEEDDEQTRARLMKWDEYKDDHRRGWGNTHNKG